MVTLTLVSRIVAWALALACIAAWVRFAIRKPKYQHLAYAVLGWCGNVTLFYLVVTFGGVEIPLLNLWSTWIHIHALALVLAGGLLMGGRE